MNKTDQYEFTIIVPVYNEEDNIYNLETKLSSYLPQALYKTCVLFVNDGSKDNSLKYLKEICQRNADFFFISLTKNSGLSAAIKAGIDSTGSKYVGYMDADLQTTPEDFNLLLKDIDKYNLVMGIRQRRSERHRMPAESAPHRKRQENTFLHRHAPLHPGTDTAPGRHHKASTREAFPAHGRQIQIPPLEQARISFSRLLRIQVDEEKIHKLCHR